MNIHRVANLLRELAEAIEESGARPKPRKRPQPKTPVEPPGKEALERVRRALRKNGVAA